MADKSTSELQLLVSLKDEMSSGLQKLGATIAGAFSVAAVLNFGEKMVSAAGEGARSQNQLNAVLASTKNISGMTTQSVNDLADSIAKKTNIDNDAIVAGSSMLLTFTRIGKDVFPQATQAMVDMATAMAGGATPNAEQLRQTSLQLGIALNSPIDGMSRLHRVGVEFTKAQKDQVEAMVKAGNTAGAQKLILNELATEFGRSAEAAKTPMQTLQRQIGEVEKALGNLLLPTVNEYEQKISDASYKVIDFIETHKDLILTIGKYVGVALTAIGTILTMVKAYEMIKAVITGFNLVTLASSGPIIVFVAAAAAAAVGITYLSDKFGGLNNAFVYIGKAFVATGQVFVLASKMLGNAVIGMINWMLDGINKGYNAVSGVLKKVGLDIGSANLKIDFKFDEKATIDGLNATSAAVNKLAADAAAAKAKAAADEKKAEADRAAAQAKLASQSAALQKLMSSEAAADANTSKKKSDLTSKIKDLAKSYVDLKNKGTIALQELKDSNTKNLKSIQDDIDKTQESINDLNKSYAQGWSDDTKSVAEEVVSTEQDLADKLKDINQQKADIAKKLNEEVTADNIKSHNEELAKMNDELVEKQTAYNKEKDGYDSQASFIGTIQNQVTEARRRASLTDLQRAVEDYQTKRQLAQQEYDEKMIKLASELQSYKLQQLQEVEMYNAKVAKINEALAAADKVYKDSVDSKKKITEDAISSEIDMYNKLAQAIAAAQSAKTVAALNTSTASVTTKVSGKKAAGGPVNSGEAYLIGEKGPEVLVPGFNGTVIPNNKLSGGGNNIVINITGNNISDKNDIKKLADAVGNAIIGKIKLNTKLAL